MCYNIMFDNKVGDGDPYYSHYVNTTSTLNEMCPNIIELPLF